VGLCKPWTRIRACQEVGTQCPDGRFKTENKTAARRSNLLPVTYLRAVFECQPEFHRVGLGLRLTGWGSRLISRGMTWGCDRFPLTHRT
jgi:hypothetical protein